MLPGLRFLFAAIVLSMSILVFGLGAAALLRAAHEEFASKPSWHATPEAMFAQQIDTTKPVLALLRVDTPVESRPDAVAAEAAPAPIASTPAEPERTAALTPESSSSPPATAKVEIPVSEAAPQVEAVPVEAATAAAAVEETKIAAVVASEADATPAAPEQASASVLPNTDIASTKIAALGGPAVTIGRPAVKAEPDRDTLRKRRQAQRAKARRRLVQRARLTAQAPQQPVDVFAQPAAPVRRR